MENNIFEAAKTVSIIDVYRHYSNCTKMQNGNVSCCMPQHGKEDKHPSMHLYPENNSFYCFKCGATGSVIDFVQQVKKYSTPEDAARDICQTFNVKYSDNKTSNVNYQRYVNSFNTLTEMFHGFLSTKDCPDPLYFEKRGLSKTTVDKMKLGYCPKDFHFNPKKDLTFVKSVGLSDAYGRCPFRGRYIFPIFDKHGNTIGFGGRSTNKLEPKYINTPTTAFFTKKDILYNYSNAKKYPEIYVVEGYFDALSFIEAGKENVVAIMGTSFTEEHLNMLKGKKIILSLDNDEAGQKKTFMLIKTHKNILFNVVKEMPYKDFNDCLQDRGDLAVTCYSNKIITGAEFMINYLKKNLDLSVLSQREQIWYDLAALIGSQNIKYQDKYPLNINYSPVAIDYYWTIVNKIIKGGRAYAKNDDRQGHQA